MIISLIKKLTDDSLNRALIKLYQDLNKKYIEKVNEVEEYSKRLVNMQFTLDLLMSESKHSTTNYNLLESEYKKTGEKSIKLQTELQRHQLAFKNFVKFHKKHRIDLTLNCFACGFKSWKEIRILKNQLKLSNRTKNQLRKALSKAEKRSNE